LKNRQNLAKKNKLAKSSRLLGVSSFAYSLPGRLPMPSRRVSKYGSALFVCPKREAHRIGKPMNEEPHIGKLIKAELARQGRSITWLAKQLGCSRQNAYKIFNRKWIYTDLLLRICDILDYDFFKCFSDYRENREQ